MPQLKSKAKKKGVKGKILGERKVTGTVAKAFAHLEELLSNAHDWAEADGHEAQEDLAYIVDVECADFKHFPTVKGVKVSWIQRSSAERWQHWTFDAREILDHIQEAIAQRPDAEKLSDFLLDLRNFIECVPGEGDSAEDGLAA